MPNLHKIMIENPEGLVFSVAFKHFTCLLCGVSPVNYGMLFVPDELHEKRYGAKPDKGFSLCYALCSKCYDHDCFDNVEAHLLFDQKQKGRIEIIEVIRKQDQRQLTRVSHDDECAEQAILDFKEYAIKQGCPQDVAEKIPAMMEAMELQAFIPNYDGPTPEEINPGFFEND